MLWNMKLCKVYVAYVCNILASHAIIISKESGRGQSGCEPRLFRTFLQISVRGAQRALSSIGDGDRELSVFSHRCLKDTN